MVTLNCLLKHSMTNYQIYLRQSQAPTSSSCSWRWCPGPSERHGRPLNICLSGDGSDDSGGWIAGGFGHQEIERLRCSYLAGADYLSDWLLEPEEQLQHLKVVQSEFQSAAWGSQLPSRYFGPYLSAWSPGGCSPDSFLSDEATFAVPIALDQAIAGLHPSASDRCPNIYLPFQKSCADIVSRAELSARLLSLGSHPFMDWVGAASKHWCLLASSQLPLRLMQPQYHSCLYLVRYSSSAYSWNPPWVLLIQSIHQFHTSLPTSWPSIFHSYFLFFPTDPRATDVSP